jgi:predicted dehydrogenase
MLHSSSRRKFIRHMGIAAAGFTIVPRHVLGKGYIPPSDKLHIAAIGAGGKATFNITQAWNKGAENIAVLCDVDDRMSADMRKKFPTAKYYKDYREMLDKEVKSIDAVMVTTPDHMHYMQTIAVMQLGKHVYTEKPLTHDIAEARLLTEAEQQYKVVTQMGNQGSSGDDTRMVESWVQKGVLGDVHTVHIWTNRPVWPQGIPRPTGIDPIPAELNWDLWLGTAPNREFNKAYLPATWRGWWDYGTGSLGDMGCHFMDVPFRALRLGYPEKVECSVTGVWSGFFQEADYHESCPPSSKVHIQFPARDNMKPVEMIWYDGGIQPKRPVELGPDEPMGEVDGGILFEGTKGKLMAGLFGRHPTLLPTNSMKLANLPAPDRALVPGGWDGHQNQWTAACKKGWGAYTSSPFSMAGPLTETVLMGNLATRSFNLRRSKTGGGFTYPGRKQLLWDGKNMRITNFDEANQFVKREYRKGW